MVEAMRHVFCLLLLAVVLLPVLNASWWMAGGGATRGVAPVTLEVGGGVRDLRAEQRAMTTTTTTMWACGAVFAWLSLASSPARGVGLGVDGTSAPALRQLAVRLPGLLLLGLGVEVLSDGVDNHDFGGARSVCSPSVDGGAMLCPGGVGDAKVLATLWNNVSRPLIRPVGVLLRRLRRGRRALYRRADPWLHCLRMVLLCISLLFGVYTGVCRMKLGWVFNLTFSGGLLPLLGVTLSGEMGVSANLDAPGLCSSGEVMVDDHL